jgi:putative FmdB family regulatory protein
MPTYEYECRHCSHRFEISQKITDQALNKCPKCKHKLHRLIGSGAGIIFKGSGFYATDYRKKSKTETTKPESNTCPQAKKGCSACQQSDTPNDKIH